MANDFYKKDGSYYQADTNAKILDLPALQKYATLGGKEIAAPTIQPTTGVGLYKAGVGTTIPNQLSTSNLTSSSTIPPAINSTQAYDEAFAKGLGLGQAQALKDLQAQQEAQKATDQSTLSSSEKAFNDLVAQISGKGKAQADLQASLGVNDMTKQLSDVNAQLAAKTGEFNSLIEQNRNKAINSRIIGGTEDKLVRQKGIETGTLSSIAQAIQGNISTAKQTAEDTIKFQYAPLEQELELKKIQLERAYDTFDASEKKRADQLLATIEAQKEQVTAEKAVKSKINDVMIAASKNGADAQTLKQIMASKDEASAILAAGKFLQDKSKGDVKFIGETTDEYGNTVKQYGYWDEATQTFKNTSGQTINQTGNTGGQMRTDRNNNATAMTTDVAKTLGLVEGVDYTVGDPFTSNGKTYQTAKLLGNSVDTTIKGLDIAAKDPSKQAFYSQSGGQRWTHTAMTDAQWLALTPEQKKSKVAEMYQKEGGDGSLIGIKDNYAANWAKLIKTGQATLDKVPEKQRPSVVAELAKDGSISSADAAVTTALTEKVNLIDSLLGSKGLNSAIGPTWLSRIGFLDTPTGVKQEFIAGVQQLLSQDTIQTLLDLKKAGGTLGALSDQERILLQSAASKIGTWAVHNKKGEVTGYNVSEKAFKDELAKVKEMANNAIKKAGGGTGIVNSLEQTLAKNPAKVDEYNKLVEAFPNLSDDEYNQLLGQ